MEFRLLGPLEMIQENSNVAPAALKPRQVLSLLLLRRKTIVQTSELIDELWGDAPPASAMTTLQTYIYRLRRTMARVGADATLRTHSGGYSLSVSESAIDLHLFEQKSAEGRMVLDRGDRTRAASVLAEALALWRGPALADVATGNLLSAYVTRLEENRFRMLELRIETDLELGRHVELISELKSLVVEHPLHERFHVLLMTALARSGRRFEALEVYRAVRGNLINELGLEPGQELQQVHNSLLSSDMAETAPASRPHVVAKTAQNSAKSAVTRPAQLPADLADFTGRASVLEALAHEVTGNHPGGARTATPMVLISGLPGVGKTALATHLAHRLRPKFPDGQLFADLFGSTSTPREPTEMVSNLLRAIGVPEGQVADSLDERSKLWRSATADRKLLVVLDDVASSEQVRPLLPGGPDCAVIISSRRGWHGIGGVRNTELGNFSLDESVELIARILGRRLTELEQLAVEQLAEAVDGLPFALRGIGAQLAANPNRSLIDLAADTTQPTHLLNTLSNVGFDVRRLYEASHAHLDELETRTLRLLGSLPVAQFTAAASAELLGWQTLEASRVLERLHEQGFVRVANGDGQARYVFPELVRAYARESLAFTSINGSGDPFRVWPREPGRPSRSQRFQAGHSVVRPGPAEHYHAPSRYEARPQGSNVHTATAAE